MALLEYSQEDNAERIQGKVWAGPDLKREGEFTIDMSRAALPLEGGTGWAWRVSVEVGGVKGELTETEALYQAENLTWREAVGLAKTRVMELADTLGAEREAPAPEKSRRPGREEEIIAHHEEIIAHHNEWITEAGFNRHHHATLQLAAVDRGELHRIAAAASEEVRALPDSPWKSEDVKMERVYEAESIVFDRRVRQAGHLTPTRWEELRERVAGLVGSQRRDTLEMAPPARERYDLETPGPTEAAAGSFQVVSSRAEAARGASRLPQSQEVHIDRVHDSHGPTDSYAVTTLPAPADVARNPAVEERIAAIEDPAKRARAEELLGIIQKEVKAHTRARSPELEESRGVER